MMEPPTVETRNNVGIERNIAGGLAHKQDGNRPCQQTADDAGTEHLTDQSGQQLVGFVVDNAAQQSAAHAAGERHQAAKAQQVAQQAGHKCGTNAIPGPQQNGAQYIDHVLHRRALAAKYRERKHAANNSNGTQNTGQSQLFGIGLFHIEYSFFNITKKRKAAAGICRQPPCTGAAGKHFSPLFGRSLLASSHAGTRLPIAESQSSGRSPAASGTMPVFLPFP